MSLLDSKENFLKMIIFISPLLKTIIVVSYEKKNNKYNM